MKETQNINLIKSHYKYYIEVNLSNEHKRWIIQWKKSRTLLHTKLIYLSYTEIINKKHCDNKYFVVVKLLYQLLKGI